MRLSTIDVDAESGSSTAGTPEIVTTATTGSGADAVTDFESVRSLLFRIAYRRLGRVPEAEDVVQDVWLRWQGVDRAQVRDRVAFLATVTSRAALNAAMSAHSRREISVDDPHHWPGSLGSAPEAEHGEALEHAVRLLMERLPPVERAVYVLREAFDYPFREIADMLGLSEGNARQLALRARRHLAVRRHHPVDSVELNRLLEAFLDAARAGNMERIIGLFQRLSAPTTTAMSPPGRAATACRGRSSAGLRR